MDFTTYKFHPSSFPTLMTGAKMKPLSDKEEEKLADYYERYSGAKFGSNGKALTLTSKMKEDMLKLEKKKEQPPELSDTCKGYLKAIYIEKVYGRKAHLETLAMRLGTLAELDGLELYMRHTGQFLMKNEKTWENDVFEGTPDSIVNLGGNQYIGIENKCPSVLR